MKDGANTQFMSSDAELLEKAANNKLTSPDSEEWQISGSPFKIIREKSNRLGEDVVCFAAWGNGKMTQDFNTPEEVTEWIENNYWNFLITVLTMAMDSRDLYKIDQVMKHAKQTQIQSEKMLNEQDELEKQWEHTLHMEIERLKEEERETFKIGDKEFIKER